MSTLYSTLTERRFTPTDCVCQIDGLTLGVVIEGAKEVSGHSGKSDEHRGEEQVITSVLFGAAGEACAAFLEQLFVQIFLVYSTIW